MPAAADDDVDKHNVDCDSDGGDDGDRDDDGDGDVDKHNVDCESDGGDDGDRDDDGDGDDHPDKRTHALCC